MTFELFIYGMAVFFVAVLLLMVACCAFIAGQAKCLELKPGRKSEIVIRFEKEEEEKAKTEPAEDKEQQKKQRVKQLLDEKISQQDKAVEEFIARGGLPR